MKINFTSFKKLFFLYFFSLLPFGTASYILSFLSYKVFELSSYPILKAGGFIGVLLYTICFSLTFAFVNWIANISYSSIKFKSIQPEIKSENHLYVKYSEHKDISASKNISEDFFELPQEVAV